MNQRFIVRFLSRYLIRWMDAMRENPKETGKKTLRVLLAIVIILAISSVTIFTYNIYQNKHNPNIKAVHSLIRQFHCQLKHSNHM